MYEHVNLKKLYYFLLIPLGISLSLISSKFPHIIDKFYTSSIYAIFISLLSRITGVFPFSLAEITIVILFIYIIFKIIKLVLLLFSSDDKKYFKIINKTINTIKVICIVYFLFIIIWGLNYHRLSFSELSGLNVKDPTIEELRLVCVDLIKKTNELRDNIGETTSGIVLFEHDSRSMVNSASIGYANVAKTYKSLSGNYGRAKAVYFSDIMSYIGISGVYFPFTAEANFNTSIPTSMIPFVIAHEMAHQRGFAREDEANYIAYVVCKLHSDIEFQYSGMLMALIYSMESLYENNPSVAIDLEKMYDDGVHRDIKQISEYWHKFEGLPQKIQSQINDVYLKSNLQEDGVKSYGRMIDLLIAETRNNKE